MLSIVLRGLAVLFCVSLVDSSCPQTVPEQRKRTISKEITELRTKQCWSLYHSFNCTYTAPVWKTEEETYLETECCKGYDNVNGTCIPQCDDCGNGKCIKPHECVCMSGYERNLQNGRCDPICNTPCLNGVCVSPDSCDCNAGYKKHPKYNFTCEPICEKGCVHGTCGSPNNCTCEPGFILEPILNNTKEQCFPMCVHSCINSDCFCACPSNYEPPKNESSVCIPKCREPCRNGYCKDPDECECYDGYKKIEPFKCVPECVSECINGICAAPNTCTCQDGYTFKNESLSECISVCDGNDCKGKEKLTCEAGFIVSGDNKTCVPPCEKPCVNANCSSQGICECWHGYDMTSDDPHRCVPVCSPPCPKSACIEPNVCELPNDSKGELETNRTCNSAVPPHAQQNSIKNHIVCIVVVTLFAGGFITALVLYLRQRKRHYRLNHSSDEHILRESFYVEFKP